MVDKNHQTRDQIEFILVDLEASNIMFPELLLGVENALTRSNEFIKTNYKRWSELYPVKICQKPMEEIKTNIAETLSQLEEVPTDMKEFLEKTQQKLKKSQIINEVHFVSLLHHIRLHSVLVRKKQLFLG